MVQSLLMEPTILEALDEENLWALVHTQVLDSIQGALTKYGEARVGLAGGSTPKQLYELLAHDTLPWDKITWVLLDERYVPMESAESNIGMIQKILFEPVQIPQENVIFFNTSLSAEESAQAVSESISKLEDKRKPLFDLLILGAGSDAHIASLFKDDQELFTTKKAYVTSAPQGYETKKRLTLSLSTLTSSQSAVLILKGKEKKQVLSILKTNTLNEDMALKNLSQKVPLKIFAYFGS